MPTPNAKTDNIFNLNFADDQKIGLTNQNTLRKVVGILGMLLPVLLWLFVLVDSGHGSPMDSLSHYYFTRAASVFCVVVSLMAIFLIIYKGKEPIDFYLSVIAGAFAFLLVLFPTDNIARCCDAATPYSLTNLNESGTRVLFHYISAAIFLFCLAIMSIFVFTKSDKTTATMTLNKKKRNLIFRICGIIMIIAMLIVFIGGFFGVIPPDVYNAYNITFWMETIAIEAFGFSWLTKGGAVIKD